MKKNQKESKRVKNKKGKGKKKHQITGIKKVEKESNRQKKVKDSFLITFFLDPFSFRLLSVFDSFVKN